MNFKSSDRLRVFLHDCQVELRVGIHAHEKEKPQPVIINVDVEMGLHHHYREPQEDDLTRVINYELIYQFITQDLSKLGHISLLEAVAELIIAFCFQDRRVDKVRVRLEKPQIFPGATGAGIEMKRLRHE